MCDFGEVDEHLVDPGNVTGIMTTSVEGPNMDASSIEPGTVIELPDPETEGPVSVASALADRRSRRTFGDGALDRETVAQLLWATQGVTDVEAGFRAAPSAGATFPLELYLAIGAEGVTDLAAGLYKYVVREHALEVRSVGDVQPALRDAALDQAWLETAPVTVVITGVDERTERQYGDRGSERYVPMEAGHAGQNLYLQAEALDLGTVAVGAFEDAGVAEVLDLDAAERPLYLMPVGPQPDGD